MSVHQARLLDTLRCDLVAKAHERSRPRHYHRQVVQNIEILPDTSGFSLDAQSKYLIKAYQSNSTLSCSFGLSKVEHKFRRCWYKVQESGHLGC